MSDTVLSTASRAVADACEELGLDVDDLLMKAGLTRAEVYDPDRRLPAARADALWQAAFERSDDPDLALHAAEALPFGAYKVIDYLVAHSATIGGALTRLASFFPLVDPRGVFEVVDGDPIALVMRMRSGLPLRQSAQEYSFTALVTRARVCVGDGWAPDVVELTFPEPSSADEHRRIFATEVRFSSAAARLLFSHSTWAAPIRGAQPALLSVLEDHARRLRAELPAGDDLLERVRETIAGELHDPSQAKVARRAGMSERTLQRRLKERGTHFARLVDETRLAVAKAHLADPAISLAEVAWLVGFSDQSAFTKAFRRWCDMPPGAWRRSRG